MKYLRKDYPIKQKNRRRTKSPNKLKKKKPLTWFSCIPFIIILTFIMIIAISKFSTESEDENSEEGIKYLPFINGNLSKDADGNHTYTITELDNDGKIKIVHSFVLISDGYDVIFNYSLSSLESSNDFAIEFYDVDGDSHISPGDYFRFETALNEDLFLYNTIRICQLKGENRHWGILRTIRLN